MTYVRPHMRKGNPVKGHFRKGDKVRYTKKGRMKGALGIVLGKSYGKVIPIDFSGYATFVDKKNLEMIR